MGGGRSWAKATTLAPDNLGEGDAVLDRDVTAPIVIKAGDTVGVTYADDGVTMTLQGKAM